MLEQLAKKYGTDKLEHGYIDWYECIMKDRKINKLLEIGIAKGASAQMWREYLPKTELHYLDLFLDMDHVSPNWLLKLGGIPHVGDQSNADVLNQINDKFDVIIDDGSHNSDHQIISFKKLFQDNLVDGGIYIVEDLHCCRDPFYWNNDQRIKSVADTMYGLARTFINTYIIKNPFFPTTLDEMNYERIIAGMTIHCEEKLLIIHKTKKL